MTNKFHYRFNISDTVYKAWFTSRKYNFELKLRSIKKNVSCWKLENWEFNKRKEEGSITVMGEKN